MPCAGPFHFSYIADNIYDFCPLPTCFYHSLCADVGYCHWAVRMYMCFSISMYTYSIHCSYNDVEIA